MATLSSSSKLPELPPVEKLSGSVVRILGGNGGKFTLQGKLQYRNWSDAHYSLQLPHCKFYDSVLTGSGTNTYLLGTNSNSLILIDTAQGFPQWKQQLSSYLKTNNLHIKTCILTHWHGDHIQGVPDLLELSPDTTLYKNQTNKLDPDDLLSKYTIQDIQNGQRFSDDENFEIEAVHCPGHTKDHMAFIITKSRHAEEIGRMFTGDNVLGHGTAVFEDLGVYLKSLNVMKSRIQQETTAKNVSGSVKAYPGHGAVVDNAIAKIDEYIKHRKMREDEALNVLKFGSVKSEQQKVNTAKQWTSMDMVKVMYKDVPENLHLPAQMGLLMVLKKLKDEGRVVEDGDDQWRVVENKSAL